MMAIMSVGCLGDYLCFIKQTKIVMKALDTFFKTGLLGLLLFIANTAIAQQRYILASTSELKIEGTSTIRDWAMVSTGPKGHAFVNLEHNRLQDIKNLVITMPARSLKSGITQMDNHAYQSLNTKAHPEIKFELRSVEQITVNTLLARGILTIAGVARPLAVQVNYHASDEGIKFTGSTPIKFSDFKIEAPTAVMGTIKTGDNLILSFNLNFTTQNL